MKKLFCLFLALAMLASLIPAALAEEIVLVDPEEEEIAVIDPEAAAPEQTAPTEETVEPAALTLPYSGRCGKNANFTIDKDGTLTVTGTGDMEYTWFSSTYTPWEQYSEHVKRVVILNGVTNVAGYAFRNFVNLSSVSLADSITGFGNNAFEGCTKLSSLELPTGLKTINGWCFKNCTGLTEIHIPDGVTQMLGSVFEGCTRLKKVTLPDSLTHLGSSSFLRCKSLESITIPNSLDYLSNSLFEGCEALRSVTLPEGLESIGSMTFWNCKKLTSLKLPRSVQRIGDAAFAHSGLSSLELPDSLQSIGSFAFSETKLSSLTFPAGLRMIDEGAFASCGSLKTLKFRGSAPRIEDSVFNGVTATAWYPEDDDSWTEEIRQNYGGKITWKSYPGSPVLSLGTSTTEGVALSWTASPRAQKFELQRSTGSEWKTVQTVSVNNCTDAAAPMGATCRYRVRAFVGSEWTDWSNEVEVFFNPFADVSGKKTIEYVSWAYNNDIVKGTGATSFSPDEPCTRIQFVMMLWKMHGSPVVEGSNPFSDISGSKTTKAILWALDKGVINAGAKFDPDGNISRVQIVMILWKLAGSPTVQGENPFTDVSGSKTIKAVLWAYQNGITKGTSDTTFAPDKDCTRVQLVVFLYKYNGIYQVI